MSYFPDALLKISKANGHKIFFWKNEKSERCSELLEMARKLMNKDVDFFLEGIPKKFGGNDTMADSLY